jgi:signal transduction histidine kinase
MWQERIQRYLLPGDIEDDPGFRKEIERLSHIGLQVTGGIEIVVTAFMVTAQLMLDPNNDLRPWRLFMGTGVILLGVATLAVARVAGLRRFSRPLAAASGIATASILTWMLLRMTQFDPTADDFIPGNITLITLAAVAAIPMRPTDTLLFGFVMESMYVILALAAQELFNVGTGVDQITVLFIFMLTCLATALTAVLYHQRRSAWEWHRHSVQALENLRQAETRNLLAQNAASVGRLAAALSHELNSPIGALISGVDTLLLLASRQATAQAAEQQRAVVLQNEVRKSIRQSSDRLKEIIARMQRFTNLDKAEIQAANINDIVTDVTALVQPRYKEKARVTLELGEVPELVCRPQQLSAVFSNLLGNAFEATDNGLVRIVTRQNGEAVEVEIQDTGRGLEPDAVSTIFDPEFKVTGGRVAAGNWSMFSSRQIVREHGGDILLASRKGAGTTVTVTLPLQSQPLT